MRHTDPIFKKLNLLTFQDIDVSSWSYLKKPIFLRKFENVHTRNNQIHG